jgi:hypothetical protein
LICCFLVCNPSIAASMISAFGVDIMSLEPYCHNVGSLSTRRMAVDGSRSAPLYLFVFDGVILSLPTLNTRAKSGYWRARRHSSTDARAFTPCWGAWARSRFEP